MINFITSMFNLYAFQDKGDVSFSTNPEEIKCWLGILTSLSFPRGRVMWEYHFESYLPSVSNSMRRNRFEILKAHAHFSDNTKLTKDDIFTKTRPLVTMLNERFLQYAILDERLCVDESVITYFGRHGPKQFLRGKPICFDYKMWCLCDRLGYLIQCEPYHGACGIYDKELGVGASVVLDLVSELPPDVPFKICSDRFFSIKLAEILKSEGIGYIGTVKSNRTEKAPLIDSKEMAKCPRGSFDFCLKQGEGIALTTWNDNTIVSLVSTVDPAMSIVKATRWIAKDAQKKQVDQPFMVFQYNHLHRPHGPNIDNYRMLVRSKKLWWAVFAFTVDASLHNAWQLYRKGDNNSPLDYLGFTRRIVQFYLQKYGTPPAICGRPAATKPLEKRVLPGIRFDSANHFLLPAEKQSRCALCKKNFRKVFKKCRVNLHKLCFEEFHKMEHQQASRLHSMIRTMPSRTVFFCFSMFCCFCVYSFICCMPFIFHHNCLL